MATAIILILIGLFAVICTLLKPTFYWEHRKALILRKLLGDRITTIFYLVLGILLIGLGIANLLGLVSL
ncbi:MAG TPA: hypothetical protein GX498_07925 [Clostridiales bacterium]|nr:hypothetical protein [Clostridiales bacterium]